MAQKSSQTQRRQIQSNGWFLVTRFANLYYFLHTLVIFAYYPIRMYFLDSKLLRETDWMGYSKEGSIIFMFLISSGLKYRRSSTLEEFIASFYVFTKVAFLVLVCLTGSRVLFVWLGILFLVLSLTLTQPVYKGPHNVIHLTGNDWETKVENDKSDVFWLVEFYATWASGCTQFASLFAEMSLKYTSPGLKFAKLDVGYYDTIADKYKISLNHWSTKELPTLMLFRNGEWVEPYRLPPRKEDGTVTKCTLNLENVNSIFYLEHLTNHRPKAQGKENQSGGSARRKKKR